MSKVKEEDEKTEIVEVKFLPSQKVSKVQSGSTILQAAIEAGVQLESTCGGRGTCGKCRVELLSESRPTPLDIGEELPTEVQLKDSWVLACKCMVEENMVIRVSEQKDAFNRKVGLDQRGGDHSVSPSIVKHFVTIPKPNTSDQRSDWERLVSELNNPKINFNRRIAASLPGILRKALFQVTVVLDGDEIIAVEPGDTTKRSYGAAIDIGTTTIVVYLHDLNSGEVIARGALTNPQQGAGADVIARITYTIENENGINQLQDKVVSGINHVLSQLSKEYDLSPQEIYKVVVVGNTTMSHLFLGIDPAYLAPAPFVPAFRQMVTVKASELGMKILETGNITVLPNIAGYVGSDTVGVMLAAEVDHLDGIHVLVDIGTNGEIVLVGKDRILTCSTAAGPAFEGAGVKHGMRAAEGAIERVNITTDVELGIIGEEKARGICGSGLIDAISEMYKAGIIDSTGRMVSPEAQVTLPEALSVRLQGEAGGREFILVRGEASSTGENIVISQKDIRELQLAKGAILAGIRILLSKLEIQPEEINQIHLAGAFGNYIQKECALGIGLLPSVSTDRIQTIGNAAGKGAQLALLSVREMEKAAQLALRAEHVELSTQTEFQDEFIKALALSQ